MIKTANELRKAFWAAFPELRKVKKITDYSGNGKMWPTDVRVAFANWLDTLKKGQEVDTDLANTVTLSP